MDSQSFDAIVIGAGQAGPSLAVDCAHKGMRTALIERERLGGTCVNVGCIPTKTLVASARAAQVARRAAEWGVQLDGGVRVDMAAVKARKDGVVNQSRQSLDRWIAGTDRLTLILGAARFVDAHTVEVNGQRLSAPRSSSTSAAKRRGRRSKASMPCRRWTTAASSSSTRCLNIWWSSAAATSAWSSRRCTAASARR